MREEFFKVCVEYISRCLAAAIPEDKFRWFETFLLRCEREKGEENSKSTISDFLFAHLDQLDSILRTTSMEFHSYRALLDIVEFSSNQETARTVFRFLNELDGSKIKLYGLGLEYSRRMHITECYLEFCLKLGDSHLAFGHTVQALFPEYYKAAHYYASYLNIRKQQNSQALPDLFLQKEVLLWYHILQVDKFPESGALSMLLAPSEKKEERIKTARLLKTCGDVLRQQDPALAHDLYNKAQSFIQDSKLIAHDLSSEIESSLLSPSFSKEVGFFNAEKHKQKLAAIREELKGGFVINPYQAKKEFTEKMVKFVERLVQEITDVLGSPPVKYVFLSLGSMSRQEMVPYSDLEFAILIDGNHCEKTTTYFRILVNILQFRVIALEETLERAALEGLEGFKKLPKGFRFDEGGHFPFGKECCFLSKTNLKVSLAQTLSSTIPDVQTISSLVSASYMFGDKSLFEAYCCTILDTLRQGLGQNLSRLILGDKVKVLELLSQTTPEHIAPKDILSLSIYFIEDLLLYYDLTFSGSGSSKIEFLVKEEVLSPEIGLILKEVIMQAWQLRCRVQFECKEEEDLNFSADCGEELFVAHKAVLNLAKRFLKGPHSPVLKDLEPFKELSTFLYKVALRYEEVAQWRNAKKYMDIAIKLGGSYKDHQRSIQAQVEQEMQALKAIKEAMSGINPPPIFTAEGIEHEGSISREVVVSYHRAILALKPLPYEQARKLHRKLYISLPIAYKDPYVKCLLELEDNNGVRLQALQDTLEQYPSENGARVFTDKQHALWRQRLKTIISDEPHKIGEKVIVTGIEDDLSEHFLNPQALSIINFGAQPPEKASIGHIIRTEKFGRRPVAKVPELKLHFKEMPELPGMEYAIASLFHRIAGGGAPFSRLVKFTYKGQSYPVQISQTISSERFNLQTVLREQPDLLKSIDAKSFSWMVIMSLLINPEDAKPDNYLLLPKAQIDDELQTYEIIAIDNDHAFVPAITKQRIISKPKLMVKSIIYCMQQMHDPLHTEVTEELLSLNLNKLMNEWLINLEQVDNAHRAFFTNVILGENQSLQTLIPMMFQNGSVRMLYEKLYTLKSILKNSENITHMELLKMMEPLLGKLYGLPELGSIPEDIFNKLCIKGYDLQYTEGGCKRATKLDTIHFLQSMLQALPDFEEIKKGKKHSVRQALQELHYIQSNHVHLVSIREKFITGDASAFMQLSTVCLKQEIVNEIKFASIPDDIQLFILKSIKGSRFTELSLSGCRVLTDSLLQQVLKDTSCLMSLNLKECEKITVDTIRYLAQTHPNLEKLVITNAANLKKIKGLLGGSISFLHLRLLDLSDNVNLNLVCIHAPNLQSLILNNCSEIEESSVKDVIKGASALQNLELKGCAKISFPNTYRSIPGMVLLFLENRQFGISSLMCQIETIDFRGIVLNNEIRSIVLEQILRTLRGLNLLINRQ